MWAGKLAGHDVGETLGAANHSLSVEVYGQPRFAVGLQAGKFKTVDCPRTFYVRYQCLFPDC